ncbi:MAG TPA: hypothetical protein VG796_09065 [Verrucomicrobiales bacterium]|nr:hypothetical protein [Verrucomicrobiales bacterium]
MKTIPVSLAVALASLPCWLPSAHAITTVTAGTVTAIHGPADLDLAGEFAHAINFSLNDPAVNVNGVKFTPDRSLPAGYVVGNNQVSPWGTKPTFGTDVDSDNLEQVYEDIRWCQPALGQSLQAHLPVTSGQTYKIQILFYANSTENRRWDIEIEGVQTVDEITSMGPDAPPYTNNTGYVYTHTVTASDSTLDIRMGDFGGTSDGGDRNAIWQGLTVEHIVPDTEPDGLPDAYEIEKFGSIAAQTGAGDADSDGLSNQYEYQFGSNPNLADTDGDGLADGNEYFTRRSNPLAADSDGDGLSDGAEVTAGSNPLLGDSDSDGLSDGAEVNVYHTNPVDRDSDHDGFGDIDEVTYGTNPADAASLPLFGSRSGVFTGGDTGEGLDLDGTFLVAARFGVSSLTGSWQVRDANFVPYTTLPNLTQDAVNEIAQWVTANFAAPATTNDTNLREVVRSIRYNGGVFNVSIAGLTVGRSYKLQLLFAEACCNTRGFDIYVNDLLVGDEFAPGVLQGGASGTPVRGSMLVYGFTAESTTLAIRLDKATVTTPGLNDPNPILNALTLEENFAGANTDPDSLPDSWEMRYFNNLNQGDNGDPDADGLSNVQELLNDSNPNAADTDGDGFKDGDEISTYHTNPRVADSDRDGLSDGAEVLTHGTDPLKTDSDGDTLTDGDEINVYHTNPAALDSDGDGVHDLAEVLNGSNPASAASTPGGTYVTRVFGADAGEGLDLQGTFLYAFNVGTNGAPGQIHDAFFTDDFAPGVTVTAPNQIPNFDSVVFNGSLEDSLLSTLFQSIRWADAGNADPNMRSVKVDLTGLTVGQQYKLQLMFGEGCCTGRAYEVLVDGNVIAHEFNTSAAQGGILPPRATGGAIVHTFTATQTTLHIELDGRNVLSGNDGNAILSGVTLETVTAPVNLEITSFTRTATSATINSRGTPGKTYSVDFSPNLINWEEALDNLVPNPSGDATWTDIAPTRVNRARGFYKVRDPVLDPTP